MLAPSTDVAEGDGFIHRDMITSEGADRALELDADGLLFHELYLQAIQLSERGGMSERSGLGVLRVGSWFPINSWLLGQWLTRAGQVPGPQTLQCGLVPALDCWPVAPVDLSLLQTSVEAG